MRPAVVPLVALGLALAPAAHAGGIGLVGTGGFQTDHVYFYDASDDYAQYEQTQTLADFGGGVEIVLGDKDDKIIGIFRGYYLQDSPEKDPATITTLVDADNVVATVRTDPKS